MTILLVEDQKRLAQALTAILEEEGYHVDALGDGRSGLDYALSAQRVKTPYDLIILDVMLPGMDGFAVTRELRRAGSASPIIMLTARDTLNDKITGLDAGADDYLTKPFQPTELLARLRALTRRSGPVHIERVVLGNTILDLQGAELLSNGTTSGSGDPNVDGAASGADGPSVDGAGAAAGAGAANPADSTGASTAATDPAGATGATRTNPTGTTGVHLSQREFELCQLFMTHPGQTLTKAGLLARIWGLDTNADENNVEIYISFLRKKLSYLKSNLNIATIRGVGYRLETPENAEKDSTHAH
jgi:DNA-binding response OmpR family regulator